MKEKEFEEKYLIARACPHTRQELLDEIDLGEYDQYISSVRRAEVGSFAWTEAKSYDPKTMMYNRISLLHVQNHGKSKSPVFVLDDAFRILENPHDFLSYLLHHEGDHARQRMTGIIDMSRSELEKLAWSNQLKHLDIEKNSPEYISRVYREMRTRS